MSIKITFLGTGSMVPTKERNHSAVFIRYQSEGILVDCGEGTQRQFHYAKIPLSKVTKILITHWHGDHSLGLPGLIQSLSATTQDASLHIYGPLGTKEKIAKLLEVFPSDNLLSLHITDLSPGVFFKNKDFSLEAVQLDHSIPCLGFIFKEVDRRKVDLPKMKKFGLPPGPEVGKLTEGKSITYKGKKISPDDVTKITLGKKIGIISDTVICKGCNTIAKDSDLLISESSYTSQLEGKADQYKHLTSLQAAQLASRNNSKKLILTHFSARYKTPSPLLEEATTVFQNTLCARDLMTITI